MQVGQAKRVAGDWVLREASGQPGFHGAYVAGSVNWLPDDADLPTTSDLDISLVFDADVPLPERRKVLERGALLEISSLPLDRVRSPEQVLGHYALAGAFHVPNIIVDPTGHLTSLQEAVSRQFSDPVWVRRRCESALSQLHGYLGALDKEYPLHHHTILWAFGASVTTLVPLVAALQNPTVRRRFVAAREVLARHGRLDVYWRLLEVFGCAEMSRRQVEAHLRTLEPLYDTAAGVMRSSYPFSADISPRSRHVTFDGSRDLIERGLHREVVWWLVATYGRCMTVLADDAPALADRFAPGLEAILADLGIAGASDFRAGADRVRATLPLLCEVAEEIIAANPFEGETASS
jgi:hypothetical protein